MRVIDVAPRSLGWWHPGPTRPSQRRRLRRRSWSVSWKIQIHANDMTSANAHHSLRIICKFHVFALAAQKIHFMLGVNTPLVLVYYRILQWHCNTWLTPSSPLLRSNLYNLKILILQVLIQSLVLKLPFKACRDNRRVKEDQCWREDRKSSPFSHWRV